ncbi:MAG: Co2+/Mg2+ efflux protein ApaG [Gammaproteobacteria bacterium]|nr:MAG: Co2+/Mg2+ efflux protein ApaG [Gammaproteobacteria bacterium]
MKEPSLYSIDVDAKPNYIAAQSDPEQDRYVFSYTITIQNTGNIPARLMTRHWIITNANGEVQEVKGDGVVGEQPLLRPGEGYQYTSGTIMETPVGSMRGSYQMVAEDGTQFDAEIPTFTLAVPGSLN